METVYCSRLYGHIPSTEEDRSMRNTTRHINVCYRTATQPPAMCSGSSFVQHQSMVTYLGFSFPDRANRLVRGLTSDARALECVMSHTPC